MKVPSAILTKLICENCEGYLSRGPIFMLDNGQSRCGRCIEPEQGANRNLPYEELAKLMTFPCRYKEDGCQENVQFRENQEHEEACAFRPFVCPIVESGKCEWFGGHGGLLEHCKAEHSGNIIKNPCKLTHNILKTSLHNYLLPAFQVLFLVQTKVCVTSRKLYYCVRLIGNPKTTCKYQFDIEIENNGKKLNTPGNVAPQGYLVLQEDISVAIGINGLLEILGNFRDTIFTLTVRLIEEPEAMKPIQTTSAITTVLTGTTTIVKKNKKKNKNKSLANENKSEAEKIASVSTQVNCVKCKVITKPVFHDEQGWRCKQCGPTKIMCKNSFKGCTYKDIDLKCRKHEEYYCSKDSHCHICVEQIGGKTLDAHYKQAHKNITYTAGSEFNISSAFTPNQWYIISTDFGKALCQYNGSGSDFHLFANSPLQSARLYLYKCVVTISHPVKKTEFKRIADVKYNWSNDWFLHIPKSVYGTYVHNGQFNIKIDFVK